MSYQRRSGIRSTVIRTADRRAAGHYEQTADWPSVGSLYAATAATLDHTHSITVTGLVDVLGPLRYSDLVALARVFDDGTFAVSMADLLAAVRLMASAEVLTIAGLHGDELAVPVRDALQHDAARLTLGTTRAPLSCAQGGPVRIDVPDWTDADVPLAVMSIRAMTFEDFVGCW